MDEAPVRSASEVATRLFVGYPGGTMAKPTAPLRISYEPAPEASLDVLKSAYRLLFEYVLSGSSMPTVETGSATRPAAPSTVDSPPSRTL